MVDCFAAFALNIARWSNWYEAYFGNLQYYIGLYIEGFMFKENFG